MPGEVPISTMNNAAAPAHTRTTRAFGSEPDSARAHSWPGAGASPGARCDRRGSPALADPGCRRPGPNRGKAFGVFGAIAGAGGAVGLLLGGLLTQYLDWRWCLYVNLVFAAIAGAGAVVLLRRQPGQPAAAAGPARARGRGRRHVLHRLRLLQRGQRRLARAGDVGFPGRGRGAADGVRLHRDAGPPATATAADRPGPQPGRRLPVDPGHRRRHVRHLLVPHLLPAGDPGLEPGHGRRRLPAHGRRDHRQRQPGQHRAAAPHRPQVARRAGHARRRRPGWPG